MDSGDIAIETGIVASISASSIRRWLGEDKIKPWRYHSWQKSTDPQFVEKAGRVLDLYETAAELAEIKEIVCCVDEKPSIQARERVDETLPALKVTVSELLIATFDEEQCNCSVP